jgi:hypothetical protein
MAKPDDLSWHEYLKGYGRLLREEFIESVTITYRKGNRAADECDGIRRRTAV